MQPLMQRVGVGVSRILRSRETELPLQRRIESLLVKIVRVFLFFNIILLFFNIIYIIFSFF